MSKPKICALPGCTSPVREGAGRRYCSPFHAALGKSESSKASARRWADRNKVKRRSGVGRTHHVDEHDHATRQAPPRRVHVLTIDPTVPWPPRLRPAPVRVYPLDSEDGVPGMPMPFQDDLNAIRDHGSPGALHGPHVGQARASGLVGIATEAA